MDYRDFYYDVSRDIVLTAGQYINDLPIEIQNPSAPWFWTGTLYYPAVGTGAGALSISVQDALGRQLSSAWPPSEVGDVPIESFAGLRVPEPSSTPDRYMMWPRNSRVRLNLRETTGLDSVSLRLTLRGFLRYREVAAC